MRKVHPGVFGLLMAGFFVVFFIVRDIPSAPLPPPNAILDQGSPSDADITGGASRGPGIEPAFYGKTATDLKMQVVTPLLVLDNNVLVFRCTSDELISAVWRWNRTHPDLPIVQVLSFDTRPGATAFKVYYMAITFERTPLREQRG